jgi:hypothetical protein
MGCIDFFTLVDDTADNNIINIGTLELVHAVCFPDELKEGLVTFPFIRYRYDTLGPFRIVIVTTGWCGASRVVTERLAMIATPDTPVSLLTPVPDRARFYNLDIQGTMSDLRPAMGSLDPINSQVIIGFPGIGIKVSLNPEPE